MKNVVDLHPEDLLDKEAAGELTDSERARLDAHLARCATCRFERQARADFAAEMADEHSLSASELIALVENAPKLPPAPEPKVEEEQEPEPAPIPLRRSSRPRRSARVYFLVAAALLVGTAAGATVGVRTWAHLTGNALDPTVTPRTHEESPPTKKAPGSVYVNVNANANVPAPGPEAPAPVETSAPAPAETMASPIPAATPAPATAFTAPTTVAVQATPAPATAFTPPTAVAVHATAAPAPSSAHAVPAPSAPAVTANGAPAEETAASAFENANDARRKGDHATAIYLYRKIQLAYPNSREAHVSYATLGQLLLDRGDAQGALQSFDAYQSHGSAGLDDAVMASRARALERLGRGAEARAAWKALLDRFPSSPYAKLAEARAAN